MRPKEQSEKNRRVEGRICGWKTAERAIKTEIDTQQIKKGWVSSVGHRHKPQHPHHAKVSRWGPCMQSDNTCGQLQLRRWPISLAADKSWRRWHHSSPELEWLCRWEPKKKAAWWQHLCGQPTLWTQAFDDDKDWIDLMDFYFHVMYFNWFWSAVCGGCLCYCDPCSICHMWNFLDEIIRWSWICLWRCLDMHRDSCD